MAGIWKELQPAPLDPIMASNERWPAMQQTHPDAVKTTVGVLVDAKRGHIWRPSSIAMQLGSAMTRSSAAREYDYLPQLGLSKYREGAARLVMGDTLYEDQADSMVSAQTLGGTTTLTLAGKTFLKAFDPEQLGDAPPTLLYEGGWKNHEQVFGDDYTVKSYRHLDEQGNYNHAELLEKISQADPTTVVLLQACGTNDDGIDRTPAQWDEVLDAVATKELPLILDTAYAGLAQGFTVDRYPIAAAAKREIFTAVGISNSKNLGLYDGRLGLLAFMNVGKGNNPVHKPLEDLLKKIIRGMYSSPPRFPAQMVGNALTDNAMRTDITSEIETARLSLVARRRAFARILPQFPAIARGNGLFTKLLADGFTDYQFAAIENQGVLVLPSSRINIGGITETNIPKVGAVISEVLRSVD